MFYFVSAASLLSALNRIQMDCAHTLEKVISCRGEAPWFDARHANWTSFFSFMHYGPASPAPLLFYIHRQVEKNRVNCNSDPIKKSAENEWWEHDLIAFANRLGFF
jgi:hypothetical protein